VRLRDFSLNELLQYLSVGVEDVENLWGIRFASDKGGFWDEATTSQERTSIHDQDINPHHIKCLRTGREYRGYIVFSGSFDEKSYNGQNVKYCLSNTRWRVKQT